SHQFFPAGVPEHAQECVITIQQFAFGGGNENAFLHLLKEKAILLFGNAPVGRVTHHMNGAFLLASLLHVGGGGNHGKAAEAWIGAFVEALVATVTERTSTPCAIISWHTW